MVSVRPEKQNKRRNKIMTTHMVGINGIGYILNVTKGYGFYLENTPTLSWKDIGKLKSFPCLKPVLDKYGLNSKGDWKEFQRANVKVHSNGELECSHEYATFLADWLACMVNHYAGYDQPEIRLETAEDIEGGWTVLFPEDRAAWEYTQAEVKLGRKVCGLMDVSASLLGIKCETITPVFARF
jgi:hypothetical protein